MTVSWADNFLVIRGKNLPGGELKTWYIEAFCRPGSTDRDWSRTVIPHKTVLVRARPDGSSLELRSTLEDGVIVTHHISAGRDDVTLRLIAENPTNKVSQAHWGQPCVRVDSFTGVPLRGRGQEDYLPKCFIFVDGKLTRLAGLTPWAVKARYVPGQVWCPKHVDRNDVNPRPLSEIVPSNGLIGCFSADEKWVLALAWEPYQELFQGIICCLHSDFRIGGLKPGERKEIKGKVYIMPADAAKLTARYEQDFPTHVAGKP